MEEKECLTIRMKHIHFDLALQVFRLKDSFYLWSHTALTFCDRL